MTCIVGFVDGEDIHMGADSAGVSGPYVIIKKGK